MNIDLVTLWWSVAGPLTLGILACAELSPTLKTSARRLGAYVLPIPFFMKLQLAGVDIHATSNFFVSAVWANLVLVTSLRYYLNRKSGFASLFLGWCMFGLAAYFAFQLSSKMPPLIWAVIVVLGVIASIDHILLPSAHQPKAASNVIPWGAVACRMLIALIYINAVVAAKKLLGPQASSALVAFPSIFCLTSILALRHGGKEELERYLRQYALGIASCAVFGAVLTQLPTGGLAITVAGVAAFATSLGMDQLVKAG